MQSRAVLLLLVLGWALAINAARILVVLPTNTRSHYVMYGRLIQALASRNHHLTVVSHFPMKNRPENVIEINLEGTKAEIINNLSIQQNHLKPNFIRNLENIIDESVQACDTVSRLPATGDLLNSTSSFDLVIVEVFGSECFLPLGQRFRAPVVGLLSSVPVPWLNQQIGNPEGTAYIPAYMMSFGQRMNLWERFVNTLSVVWAKILYKYKSQIPSQVIAERLFGPISKLESLAQNYSLILSNSHFSINEVRPLVPALVEVGGLHLDDSQTLSRNLKLLLDASTEGVIYWSFGSMARIETISSYTLAQIFQVMAGLSQTVLVKMNRALLPMNITVPHNVYATDWIPQYATLCHPNAKLFISHGGLLGTQEAVACAVPMLMVPLYADQALNARAMTDRGVALTVSLAGDIINTWRNSIHDLIRDPKYKLNAVKLSEIFLDRPIPPLEMGVYWLEYVLRHKGAHHMRSPALDLTLPQYLLLDVIVLCLILMLLTIFILHILFRYLSACCIRWWSRENRFVLVKLSHFIFFLWKYKVKTN